MKYVWLDDSIDNREPNFDGFEVAHKERIVDSLNARGGRFITFFQLL